MKKQKEKAARAEEKKEKVRDWLLREHPEEETMIGDFSKTVTFQEVADRMRFACREAIRLPEGAERLSREAVARGRAGEEFYEICDCGESVQREYCFGRMAELFGTNYEYWYRTWLDRKPPTSLKPRPPRRMIGKYVLVTRITK